MAINKDIKATDGSEQVSVSDALPGAETDNPIHFGELDIGKLYPLPSSAADPASTSGGEFMLGEEGQEMQDALPDGAPELSAADTVSQELGALIDGFAEENDLDLALDMVPDSLPNPTPAQGAVVQAALSDLSMEPAGSQVNLDQLFDAVGAEVQSDPFSPTPGQTVALEETFWDNAPQEETAVQVPELFEPVAALNPARTLDNIFETLFAADES